MRIHDISRALAAAGTRHLVFAASPGTEEGYWLGRLAKAITGRLQYLQKNPSGLRKPSDKKIGPDTVPCITLMVWECFGKSLTEAFKHLGLGERGTRETQKSGNTELYNVMSELLRVKIQLVPVGPMNRGEAGHARDTEAYYSSALNECVFGVLDAGNRIDVIPPYKTLIHELEHARDFAYRRYRDGVYPESGSAAHQDILDMGRTYYLLLTEVKARCKEMAVEIRETFDYRLERLRDCRDLIRDPDYKDKREFYRGMERKHLASFQYLLKSGDNFLGWSFLHAGLTGKRGFDVIRKPNLETFVAHAGPVLRLQAQNEKLQENEIVAANYIRNFFYGLYRDLKARYGPVISGMPAPLHFHTND